VILTIFSLFCRKSLRVFGNIPLFRRNGISQATGPRQSGRGVTNLAKTMPLACCPPALLLSYRDGLLQHSRGEKNGLFPHVIEIGMPMDSSQSPPLNDQRHKDDVVPIVPREGPTAEEARSGGPTRDPNGRRISTTKSPNDVAVAAEQTGSTPAGQMSAPDTAPQRAPVTQTAPAPSATSFELMRQVEALARDVAVVSGRDSSDQCVGMVKEGSAGLQAGEPSIRVSPRDQLASDRPSIGRRTFLTLASFFMAALIGVGATFAWQSHRVSTTKSPNDVDVAAEQSGSAPAGHVSVQDAAVPQSAPVTQTAPAPTASATSPELVQQLEALARDLAVVRRSVEQLAAKQEHLAAAQEQLEQLAAKQKQMAQNIAKLQAVEQNIRHKMSPPPLSRAVPIPPRRNAPKDTSPETAAQLSSVPRPAPHPLPPLPVPP
jgi:hypothetical protein